MKKLILLIVFILGVFELFSGTPLLSSNYSNQIVTSLSCDFRYTINDNNFIKLEGKVLPYKKVNDTTFYKVDSNNVIFKTINMGKTWVKMSVLPDYFKNNNAFLEIVDDNTIFVHNITGYQLFGTKDGGKTWDIVLNMVDINKKYLGLTNNFIIIQKVEFINENKGIAYCTDRRNNADYYLYTLDGGKTWELSNLTDCETKLHYIATIHYDNNGDIYVVSYTINENSYLVAKSTDNGKTFKQHELVDLNKTTHYTLMNDNKTRKYVLKNTPLEFYY